MTVTETATLFATVNKMITEKSKLADVIASNPLLVSVLERMNVKLGFHEATVEQICHRYKLSAHLFTNICNIFYSSEFEPQVDLLTAKDLEHLVNYLKVSHKYYSKKIFKSLHQKIHKLLEGKDPNNQKILNKFYDDYQTELMHHFNFEEETVFPYLLSLIKGKSDGSTAFKVMQFTENHTGIEDKLADLRNIILKYLPEEYSQSLRFDILKDIISIESDLTKHTIIESKILVPIMIRLEKQNNRV